MDRDVGELLNVRETARRLGVHENTVRNWARDGVLQDARVPGSRFHRFRAADVDRLVSSRGSFAPSLQSERRIANPELVSANQLRQWPESRPRDAQEQFPELLRRLLAETPGISAISVRSGDGVALPGWDGSADSDGTPFLPSGHLAFEFGVDKDSKGKASSDYGNRIGAQPSERSFVFVTPRRWPGGRAWADERRAEGHFADVRVLDGDDLEGWLRTAPATHHWVSEHLGLRPRDAMTIDTWWARFSGSTDPALPLALFAAGRSAPASELAQRIAGPATLTTVQSESADDVLAFVHASSPRLTADAASEAPILLIFNADVWARVVEQPGRSVLVPRFDGADVGAALDRGHHVINVADRSSSTLRTPDIVLPRIDREASSSAFRGTGMDFAKASRHAALARRSLPALIRRLSRNPLIKRPSWASPPDAEVLAPLVLVGSWSSIDTDYDAVERLTGASRDTIESTIRRISASADPVVRSIAGVWTFTSPEEAFLLLHEALTPKAVERWRKHVQDLLAHPDPVLELPPEQRAKARLEGLQTPYSGALVRGAARGVALMGAMGSRFTAGAGLTLSDVAARTVEELLKRANSDNSGRTWQQLATSLPLLAEAAPDAFLSAVFDDLTSPAPVLRTLFQEAEGDRMFGPSSPHPHLLWALETVCWSEDYLVDGVRALALLAAIDPGGSGGNRPAGSMATILCGWVNQTSASLDVRIDAIDAAIRVSEGVGWQLILGLWPSRHSTVMPPASPHIRDDWRPSEAAVPLTEWIAFTHALVDRATALAGVDPGRLSRLVERLADVPPVDRERILTLLESAVPSLTHDGELVIWETLQTVVARHERFSTASWAMPAEVRGRLAGLAAQLEPRSNPQRFTYLFDWHPDLPGVDPMDRKAYSAKLQGLRQNALRSVIEDPDAIDQLSMLAQRVKAPSQLGVAMADYSGLGLSDLIPWLGGEVPSLREAAAAWARSQMIRLGAPWLAEALRQPDLTGPSRQAVLLCVPGESSYWDVLQRSSSALDEEYYWSTAQIDVVPLGDVRTAVERLRERGRAWSAIVVAAYALGEGPNREVGAPSDLGVEDLVALLDDAIQQAPEGLDNSGMAQYHLGELLDHLSAVSAPLSDMARLEFAFFNVLDDHRVPAALNRVLASQPEIFVDLVKRVYRGRGDSKREVQNVDQDQATHAWYVLHGWTGYPGQQEDGGLNAAAMERWVQEARLELSSADRADVGDEVIGETFAHAPIGADGVWPPEAVRELVERIGSRDFENGVTIGRLNSRGVTMRDVYDGGQQERELAEQYREWSSKARSKWPRTSRLLREIAESYERDARREDARADLDADRD